MSENTISVSRVYFGKDAKPHERVATSVNGTRVARKGRVLNLFDRDLNITTARMIAAALLELAEAAEAEPDPEALAELMAVIDDSTGGDPGVETEELARDILRAFKVERRASEQGSEAAR